MKTCQSFTILEIIILNFIDSVIGVLTSWTSCLNSCRSHWCNWNHRGRQVWGGRDDLSCLQTNTCSGNPFKRLNVILETKNLFKCGRNKFWNQCINSASWSELPTVPYGNAILIHEAIYSVDNIYFYFIDLVICIHSQLPEKWSWFDHDSASEDLLFLKSPQMESEFFNLRHIKVLLQKNIGLLSAEN